MAINMASSICVFALNLCVTFFLTPFIVGKLGTAAYGYIGLSNNILGYTSVLTVAINSMAGRYVTLKMHERQYTEANKYMSSVFYSNFAISCVIIIGVIIATVFLPDLIRIPIPLVSDVKTLFLLLGISSCIGLMTGIISVGAFIRNRIDITNVRNLIGSFMRVSLLLLLFGILVPRLWYVGFTILVMNMYVLVSNYVFLRRLTPELTLSYRYFDWKHVKEVTLSGAWNILSKLSEILSRGFDLLLANLFISAKAMGLLSITQAIPLMIVSFFAMLSGNFAPEFTRLYAIKDFDKLKAELLKAVRMTGFLSCIPLSIFFAYGDVFYGLWLPKENAGILYLLSCLGTFGLIFGMPQEPLWSIFTITNKVKQSSLNLFYNSIAIFLTVLLSVILIKDDMVRLICLAGIRSLYGTIRVTTFLPVYGAKCLGFNKTTFYPLIIRNLFNVCLITGLSIIIKKLFMSHTWISLIIGSVATTIIGILIASFTVLKQNDRKYIINHVKQRLKLC